MNKKNIFIYLIIVFLIVNKPITVFAQASATTPTVTIATGSGAAVGGLYNNNGTKTQMIATALTLAVLSATGAAVKLSEDSIAAGKTVYQVINDKFAQWVGGTSAEELTPSQAEELQSRFKVITGGGGDPEDPDRNKKNGVNVDDLGRLFFSRGSLTMIREFINYLDSKGQIIQEPTGGSAGIYPGTFTNTYQYQDRTFRSRIEDGGELLNTYFVTIKNTSGKWRIVSYIKQNNSFYAGASGGSSGVGLISTTWNDWQYCYYGNATAYGFKNAPDLYNLTDLYGIRTADQFRAWLDQLEPSTSIDSDGIYKGENYDSSILDNPNNLTLVINPGILPYINPNTNQQINIPDYLQLIIDQAQANATAQNQPISVPAIDPATLAGSQLQVPVIEQDPIVDPMPSEVVDPEQTPDNPVQDSNVDPSSQESIELMLVDLTRIFPFCIPWDIYHLISKFNAEPVTPSLDIDFGNILGSVGIDYSMHIDLHDYDGVAQVLRTMELIAFVLGLAAATRSIFLHD